uniref:Uncharacterized protein n=1 Tax=Knipowitschia caucasica TaxID=637954 RepID=A0AAV2MNE7_KNICA
MVLRVALLGGTCRKCLEVRKKFCVAPCALGSGRCGGLTTKGILRIGVFSVEVKSGSQLPISPFPTSARERAVVTGLPAR